MAANSRRVFYVHEVADPVYLEVMAKEASIQIDKLENDSDDATAAPVLAAAHGYQIQSGRHTLNERFHLTRDLIARGEVWQLPPYRDLPVAETWRISNPRSPLNAAEAAFLDACGEIPPVDHL